MTELQSVPLLAMVAILAATLSRGFAIRRATGDRAWAFVSAKGLQRIAGGSFALSVAVLLAAAALAAAALASVADPARWTVLAAIAATVGTAVVIVAQVQMGRAWRVGVRAGDAPLFVSHGLFRFSRNPIFVGMMIVGLATALASGQWWSWVALAIFIASCAVQVRIEEAHLEASFGQPYRDFRAQIPRWLGAGGRA